MQLFSYMFYLGSVWFYLLQEEVKLTYTTAMYKLNFHMTQPPWHNDIIRLAWNNISVT